MPADPCKALALGPPEVLLWWGTMPRSRSARARPRRRARPDARRETKPSEAERRPPDLARALSARPDADASAALGLLAAAHAPDAPLPRAMAQAWIRGRKDKTATLALAWAREQVRLALEEILARAPQRDALGATVETRAWLLLAAAESIAHEPPAAAADRLRALLDLA